ncbi:unnamed protein product [Withania somnifera]
MASCIASPFSPKLYSSKILAQKSRRISIAPLTPFLKFRDSVSSQGANRGFTTLCFSSPRNGPGFKGSGPDWPILRRWDVPWNRQTVHFLHLRSFVLTGLIETASIPLVGLDVEALSLDEKAEILFADQAITTAVVLIVLYTLTKSSQPLPDDIYRYDLKEPFNLQRGWLLWSGIGLAGAVAAIALTGVAMSTFNGYLHRLQQVISGAVFALAHLTPGQFPQLFVLELTDFTLSCHCTFLHVSSDLKNALGFSYGQTRNLLTPITIHAFWNSGVILLLTFLQLQGYDIREIIQGT